ncbi:recombinase family protein [Candidatus Woesebacteria bacterium]|nr:recombinase family protein [Candidatus Woesebacteria bacterium]
MPFFTSQDEKDFIRKLKPCCYLRKSTVAEDKQVRSISDQKRDLEEVLTSFEYNINDVPIFIDKRSAFELGRPGFNEMMSQIENGDINLVFSWHANRIARNYEDGGKFTQRLMEHKIHYLITRDGLFTSSPRDTGYLIDEFRKSTSSSADTSDGVRRGNKYKREDGYMPSGRLQPWLKHKKVGKEFVNTHDEWRFSILREAIDLILSGLTPMEALNFINEEKKYLTAERKPLSKSSFYYYLSSPLAMGKIVSNTKDDKGSSLTTVNDLGVDPLMNKDEYEKIRLILGKNTKRKITSKDWAYNGEITCSECGGAITPHERWQIKCPECRAKFGQRDRKGNERTNCPECGLVFKNRPDVKLIHYEWLTCGKQKGKAKGTKCAQKSLSIEDFESQMDYWLSKVEIPDSFVKWAIKWLRKSHHAEVEAQDRQLSQVKRLCTQTQAKKDSLLDWYLEELANAKEKSNPTERLNIEDQLKKQYEEKKEKYSGDLKTYQSKRQELEEGSDNWLEMAENTIYFANNARHWLENGSSDQKRAIIRTLGVNFSLRDKKILINQRIPFLVLAEMKEKEKEALINIGTEENIDLSGQNSSFLPTYPKLMPR